MRKHSLRQTANRYLKTDNQGSFKDKQHRAFVIHKMMDDLFIVGDVPTSWHGLQARHMQQLIQHWQQHKIKPDTIMGYMTVIRTFLNSIDCPLMEIDNHSLGLTRQYKSNKKTNVQVVDLQSITEPTAHFIMALQTLFGLTFGEAIRFVPDIHFREHSLWITREIAFNSEDRVIPLRTDTQQAIITDLVTHTGGSQCLMQLHGYVLIRSLWRQALAKHGLPVSKSYRYLYARLMRKELSPILGNYQVSWLIRNEMGIKSRNTLWLYLNE